MTDKEKALEIALEYEDLCVIDLEDVAMDAMQWKEQQMIEYLYKNIQSLLKDYGVSESSADIATQLFLANFKKAMEE